MQKINTRRPYIAKLQQFEQLALTDTVAQLSKMASQTGYYFVEFLRLSINKLCTGKVVTDN